MFVNKDVHSDILGRVSDHEAIEVRRHVQKSRLRRHARQTEAYKARNSHLGTQILGNFCVHTVNLAKMDKKSRQDADIGQDEDVRQASLRTALSQARTDPFNSLPLKSVPSLVHKIIDHGMYL